MTNAEKIKKENTEGLAETASVMEESDAKQEKLENNAQDEKENNAKNVIA